MRKLQESLAVGLTAKWLDFFPWMVPYCDLNDKLKPSLHPLTGYLLNRREPVKEVLWKAAGKTSMSCNNKAAGCSRRKAMSEIR